MSAGKAIAAVVAALLGWPLTEALKPTTVLVLLLAAWPRLPAGRR
jgi:hypothetical protein